MSVERLKRLLERHSREQIVLTAHARARLPPRGIAEEEIIENLLDPALLAAAVEQSPGRYDALFLYSHRRAHRYVLALNDEVRVVTAMRLGRRTLRKLFKKRRVQGDA